DFSAGTLDANTYIAQAGNGEVILEPIEGQEFSGTSLPATWFSTPWNTGGTSTVGSGQLSVDGARSGTTALYAPGRTLEFAATFTGDAYEHVGFGVDYNSAPWAMFSTSGGGGLYARTSSGAAFIDTPITGNWFGAEHRFRIDWTSTGVTYWIDGTQVASHAVSITASMRPLASDFTVGGGNVKVNWLHLSPYVTTTTFLSRVEDAGSTVTWGTATWNATIPTGTSLAVSVRQGNTATPDSSWTAFSTLSGPGATVGGSFRFF